MTTQEYLNQIDIEVDETFIKKNDKKEKSKMKPI